MGWIAAEPSTPMQGRSGCARRSLRDPRGRVERRKAPAGIMGAQMTLCTSRTVPIEPEAFDTEVRIRGFLAATTRRPAEIQNAT